MAVRILDGGMGRELERIGAPFRQPEWSALTLMEAPSMVERAHHNFISAGAQIITTNTYAIVPFHIGQDIFAQQGYDLALRAGRIARKCVNAEKQDIQVAGCIPPAFGSYKPELFLPTLAHDIWLPLIKAQEQFVNFWLVETLSSMIEAKAAIELIKSQSSKPLWLSFTLDNRDHRDEPPKLRSGEPIEMVIDILGDVDAILFNCSRPEEMTDAIHFIRHNSDKIDIGVYPNAFSEIKRTHDANEGLSAIRADLSPEQFLTYAEEWDDAGATIIGGCCGIGPDHIRAISNMAYK